MNLKFKISNLRLKQGFTLIELLLYISLTTIILLSISVFLSVLLSARIKHQTIARVEDEGSRIMDLITQMARNADAINSPVVGTSAAALSLDVAIGAGDPTIFDISGGVIRIKEGAGASVDLTSSLLTASGLNFTNLSRPTTPGIARIQFTLSSSSSSTLNEYSYSKIFTGSASLR